MIELLIENVEGFDQHAHFWEAHHRSSKQQVQVFAFHSGKELC
jgi:hypothetical protein